MTSKASTRPICHQSGDKQGINKTDLSPEPGHSDKQGINKTDLSPEPGDKQGINKTDQILCNAIIGNARFCETALKLLKSAGNKTEKSTFDDNIIFTEISYKKYRHV